MLEGEFGQRYDVSQVIVKHEEPFMRHNFAVACDQMGVPTSVVGSGVDSREREVGKAIILHDLHQSTSPFTSHGNISTSILQDHCELVDRAQAVASACIGPCSSGPVTPT